MTKSVGGYCFQIDFVYTIFSFKAFENLYLILIYCSHILFAFTEKSFAWCYVTENCEEILMCNLENNVKIPFLATSVKNVSSVIKKKKYSYAEEWSANK